MAEQAHAPDSIGSPGTNPSYRKQWSAWIVLNAALLWLPACARQEIEVLECIENSDCDDGNPCTKDECAENERCLHAEMEGQPCDDGSFCNGPDMCNSGKCQPGGEPPCAKATNPCLTIKCDETRDECSLPTPNNDPCEDGDPCTEKDYCEGGKCLPGAVKPGCK